MATRISHVAVVDDELPVRTALGRLQRLADYDVAIYASGEVFLAALDARRLPISREAWLEPDTKGQHRIDLRMEHEAMVGTDQPDRNPDAQDRPPGADSSGRRTVLGRFARYQRSQGLGVEICGELPVSEMTVDVTPDYIHISGLSVPRTTLHTHAGDGQRL